MTTSPDPLLGQPLYDHTARDDQAAKINRQLELIDEGIAVVYLADLLPIARLAYIDYALPRYSDEAGRRAIQGLAAKLTWNRN